MSITFDDVAEVLAYCAFHDKRFADENDIQDWFDIATDQRWTREAALRVAREHYGRGADKPRLEANAITDRIRVIRKKAAETFEYPRIPEHVSDAEYPTWLRAQRDAHVNALVARWSAGGEEPPVQLPSGPPPNQLAQRRIAELTAGAFREIPKATPDGKPATTDGMQQRRSALARPCPYCEARPHEPCTRSGAGGRVRLNHPHPARAEQSARPSEEAS